MDHKGVCKPALSEASAGKHFSVGFSHVLDL